ncbi:hypothetical protein [Planococcus rifietoensis]|uniref:hypothetical protein n=1 Tax=Planococcus rifietoensis TaxID=200991 RepID=UPI0012EDF8C2|nr:hypothetical protein [Planococcus rifietoensis]
MTPRIWALELDKKKSGSGRYASTGVRRMPEAALFAAQDSQLTTREAGRCNWTRRKAEVPKSGS